MDAELATIGERIRDAMQGIGTSIEQQVSQRFANPNVDRGHHSDPDEEVSFISIQRQLDPSGESLDLVMGVQRINGRVEFFSSATELGGAGSTEFEWTDLAAGIAGSDPDAVDRLVESAARKMRDYVDAWLQTP